MFSYGSACKAIIALTGAAWLIAACGSSSSSTTGSSVSSTSSTSQSPIKVMQIGTFESPGLSLIDAEYGVKARVAQINAAGGINGHKIDVSYCNDAFNADTAEACARTAVQNGDVAIVGGASGVSPVIFPILKQAGIPWLAGTGSGGPIEQTSDLSYPLTGGTQSVEVGMGRILTDLGDKNIVVIVADAAAAFPAGDAVKQGLTLGGGTSTRVLATIGAPDFSSVASAALSHHPDGVAIASVPTDAPRIILALRQAGYKGAISTLAGIVSEQAIQSLGSNAANLYLLSDLMPTTYTSNPAIQAFTAGMMAAGYGAANIDTQSLGGWNAVNFFAAIVKYIGSGAITSQAIIKELANLPSPISLGTVPDYKGVPSPPLVAAYPRVPTFDIYASEVSATGTQAPYNNGQPFNPLG
jgi:branched-chain amino acid transport system substrate-binding protein